MTFVNYIRIKTVEVKRIPGSITTFSRYYCTIEVQYRKDISGTFGFETFNGEIRQAFTNKFYTFKDLIQLIESEKSN